MADHTAFDATGEVRSAFDSWTSDFEPYLAQLVQLPDAFSVQLALPRLIAELPLGESSEFATLLSADPDASRHIGHLVGHALGARRWDLEFVLRAIAGIYVSELRAHSTRVDAREAVWESVRTSFAHDQVYLNLLVPLYGVAGDTSKIPIGADVILRPMERSERSFEPEQMASDVFTITSPTHCLSIDVTVPKVIKDDDEPSTSSDPEIHRGHEIYEAHEKLRDAARVLVAFRSGTFTLGRFHQRAAGIVLDVSSTWNRREPAPDQFDNYVIESAEVEDLTAFATALLSLRNKDGRRVRVALRRFATANLERSRTEDSLVDILIAAEALFLSDSPDTGELTFRLSLRAAGLLSSESQAAKKVSADFKKLYGYRSTIVHGGQIGKPTWSDEKREEELGASQELAERYLRETFHAFARYIHDGSRPGTSGFWEDLVLPAIDSYRAN